MKHLGCLALALALGACGSGGRPGGVKAATIDLKAARGLVVELIRAIEHGEREQIPFLLSLSHLARVTQPRDLPQRPTVQRRFREEVVERLVSPSGPVRRLLSGAEVTGASAKGRVAVVLARSSTATLRFVVAAREGGLRVVQIE